MYLVEIKTLKSVK